MAGFNVTTAIKYFALGFGALLVGMQIGYTVHYTTVSSTQTDAGHREAYEYMVALHDMQAEGLISEADRQILVAKHRSEITGERQPAVAVKNPFVQKHVANGNADGSSLRQVKTVAVNESPSSSNANGLCDGRDPKNKKLVFIKVRPCLLGWDGGLFVALSDRRRVSSPRW